MHVFISDLHMTDMAVGSPVSDASLSNFVDELRKMSKKGHVTLVIVGDGVDLLRSRRWYKIAKHGFFPWSGMAPDFPNFKGNRSEETAIKVLIGIRARYTKFEKKLRRLVSNELLEVRYIVGNHDYMLQLSPGLRGELVEFLSLADDPDEPFPFVFEDQRLSIHAQHGHAFDPVNWHNEDRGYWALGDAIVLRVINRFAEEANKTLGLTRGTPLGKMFEELDNVLPNMDVPVFVRWLTDNLPLKSQRDKVFKVWQDAVDGLLDDADLNFVGHPEAISLSFVRTALRVSKHKLTTELINLLKIDPPEHDFREHAETQAAALGKYRYILFGHTHTPKIVPLRYRVGKQSCYYVNTGCWRRVWVRPDRSKLGPFVPTQIASYFQIGPEPDSTRFVHHGTPCE